MESRQDAFLLLNLDTKGHGKLIDTSKFNNVSDLDALFPLEKIVKVRLPKAEAIKAVEAKQTPFESLVVTAMPFLKWRDGFIYVVRLAPLLGFDLNMSPEDWEKKAEQIASAGGDPNIIEIDKSQVMAALVGDSGKMIYEFLAFAIDKPVTYFDHVYEEAVDIIMAVIEVNVNFFVQWLLPKIVTGSKELGQVINQARQMSAPIN